MNDALRFLVEQLKGTSAGTKAVVGLAALALIAAVGTTAAIANRPHFQMAFSGLTDHEVAKVNKALSDAAIAFEVSQPPAPFNVFVDDSARTAAYAAVYGAGALDKPLEGILSDSGLSSVFQGSEERQQAVRKRDWQEMERIVEVLDYVLDASIRTSPRSGAPLLLGSDDRATASVAIRTAHGLPLSQDQARSIAKLVGGGLGIDLRNIVISDQTGETVYDGNEAKSSEPTALELIRIKGDFDRDSTATANRLLEETLGPGKARVTVSSEWDYDQSTSTSESASGKGSLVSETKHTTETPIPSGGTGNPEGSGPAGTSSNVADGSEALGLEQPTEEPLIAKTSEEKKEYKPTTTKTQTVRTMPVLKRLSVAAIFDASIDSAQREELAETIKAAVGFDSTRKDDFKAVSVPFAAPAEPEAEEAAAVEPAPSAPNPLVEMLIRRGVEIAVALVFVVLLLKSLKGASSVRRAAVRAAASADAGDTVDPELLARAQVEKLLQSEPGRVGEILSSWARGEVGARS